MMAALSQLRGDRAGGEFPDLQSGRSRRRCSSIPITRIWSVMVEVNRGVYMDEHSGLTNQGFEHVRAVLGRLIVTAAEAAARDLRVG